VSCLIDRKLFVAHDHTEIGERKTFLLQEFFQALQRAKCFSSLNFEPNRAINLAARLLRAHGRAVSSAASGSQLHVR